MVPPSNHLESLKGDREGQFQHPDQQTVALYFGTTAQLWQNLQAQYDLEIASQKIGKKVEQAIKPLARPDLPGRLHSHNSEPVVAFGQNRSIAPALRTTR